MFLELTEPVEVSALTIEVAAVVLLTAIVGIVVLAGELIQAKRPKPKEVQPLVIPEDEQQAFLASNPQFVAATEFRERLPDIDPTGVVYTPTFHRLLATLTLDHPGMAVVFRAIEA
jgi:hypothetical protein